jgi:hypothetical protein
MNCVVTRLWKTFECLGTECSKQSRDPDLEMNNLKEITVFNIKISLPIPSNVYFSPHIFFPYIEVF